jgi:hypothetical protein
MTYVWLALAFLSLLFLAGCFNLLSELQFLLKQIWQTQQQTNGLLMSIINNTSKD